MKEINWWTKLHRVNFPFELCVFSFFSIWLRSVWSRIHINIFLPHFFTALHNQTGVNAYFFHSFFTQRFSFHFLSKQEEGKGTIAITYYVTWHDKQNISETWSVKRKLIHAIQVCWRTDNPFTLHCNMRETTYT
jgi:hypothetical protein